MLQYSKTDDSFAIEAMRSGHKGSETNPNPDINTTEELTSVIPAKKTNVMPRILLLLVEE